jgi:hypothetical protein
VPLFPLTIVGMPGAMRRLLIFEPRYRQMFQDMFDEVSHTWTPEPALLVIDLTYHRSASFAASYGDWCWD